MFRKQNKQASEWKAATSRWRRWRSLRFSIRTLLLVVLAVGVWLGVIVQATRRQERIVSEITRSRGNYVNYAHEFDANGKHTPGAPHPAPSWLREFMGEHFFLRPRALYLNRYDNRLLEQAAQLTEVQTVVLTGIDDHGLRALSNLDNLRTLDISSVLVTKRGLAHLARLSTLQSLRIRGARIGDEDLRLLKPLGNLASLDVGDSQVTAEGIAWVKETWPKIRLLETRFPSVPEEQEAIARLSRLNVRFSADREGYVRSAYLVGRESTNEHLLQLAVFSRLRLINVENSSVTALGAAEIRRRLPGVKVIPNLREPLPEEAEAARRLMSAGFSLNFNNDGFVSSAHCQDDSLPAEAFAPLAELRQLRSVTSSSANVTDQVVEHLSSATRLSNLSFPNSRLSDAGLSHLRGKPLRRLTLGGPGITDDGLAALADTHDLRWLTLTHISLNSDGLRHLKDCARLGSIDLSGSRVRDISLTEVAHLKQLTSLNLSDSNVNDACLSHLSSARGLTHLHLIGTEITDDGLLQLRSIPTLRQVNATDTAVTGAGAAQLTEALPNCRVSH